MNYQAKDQLKFSVCTHLQSQDRVVEIRELLAKQAKRKSV